MFPLPEMIIAVLAQFAGLFSAPVRGHAQVLVIGAILCQGPRTVAAILRVMGLGQDPRFERYHRVLSRARWSGLQAARILLGLLIRLLPPQWVPMIVVDDTVERRRGKRIKAKGCYRDAVRSSQNHVVKCFGLKWACLMLLVRLPWSSRLWALPFLTVLAPLPVIVPVVVYHSAQAWRVSRQFADGVADVPALCGRMCRITTYFSSRSVDP